MMIDSRTETSGRFAQLIQAGKHSLRADMPEATSEIVIETAPLEAVT